MGHKARIHVPVMMRKATAWSISSIAVAIVEKAFANTVHLNAETVEERVIANANVANLANIMDYS